MLSKAPWPVPEGWVTWGTQLKACTTLFQSSAGHGWAEHGTHQKAAKVKFVSNHISFCLSLAKRGRKDSLFYSLSYIGQSSFMISSYWLLRSRTFPNSELSTHTQFFISWEVCLTCPPPWSQWPSSTASSGSSSSGLGLSLTSSER